LTPATMFTPTINEGQEDIAIHPLHRIINQEITQDNMEGVEKR